MEKVEKGAVPNLTSSIIPTTTTDEILQDGTKVRTLESAAATIRFCFIDDRSTDSEQDSDDTNGNAIIYRDEDEYLDDDNDGDEKQVLSVNTEVNVPVSSDSVDSMNPSESSSENSVNCNNDHRILDRQRSIVDEDQIDNPVISVSKLKNAASPTSEYFSECDSEAIITKQKSDSQHIDVQTGARPKTSYSSKLKDNEKSASLSSRPPSIERFNPFDKTIHVDDDHFSNNNEQKSKNDPKLSLIIKPSQSTSSSSGDDLITSVEEDDFVFAHLGIHEDYFATEGHFGLSTGEELELAINQCKQLIEKTDEDRSEDKKKKLVQKLVQLRMKLQESKEGPKEVAADVKLVMGHHFQRQESRSAKHYCEKCVNVIWGMIQIWYQCKDCGYSCHSKCLGSMTRMCALTKIQESPQYIMSIRPERGLDTQLYRCSECRALISFKSSEEPRQCDYNGNYYCSLCHWNDTSVIPARVLHNWDFTPFRVCRASKQYLKLMQSRPVISVQDANPMLFSFVEELSEIKRLRHEILMMKQYFLSCQEALSSKLLLQLSHRQHFVDDADMYSLQDLIDLESESLVPELCKIHTAFAQHIKTECMLCLAKGHICEICNVHELVFPFDNHVFVCNDCQAVMHKHCFRKKEGVCPRCQRKKVKVKP